MSRKPLTLRQHISWHLSSVICGALLVGFGYYRRLFEGDLRWLMVATLVLVWLLVVAITSPYYKDRGRENLEEFYRKRPGEP
jgi:hypothetical protein